MAIYICGNSYSRRGECHSTVGLTIMSALTRFARRRTGQEDDVVAHRAAESSSLVSSEKEAQKCEGEMPPHWKLEFECVPCPLRPIVNAAIQKLCLVSFGFTNLDKLWQICCEDEKTWVESTSRLCESLNTIVVMVSCCTQARLVRHLTIWATY